MSVTELGISGMSCASCASHVTEALQGVQGVAEANVNLATERARVLHDPSVDPAALVAAVEAAGYEASARPNDADDSAQRAAGRRQMLLRLVVALAFAVPATILAMFAPDFPGKAWWLGALTVPVWAFVGWEFHGKALRALRSGNATMDTLVSLGSTAALAIGYFETACAIITLVFIGRYLESLARTRSGEAMRALLSLQPERAHRRESDGSTRDVAVDAIRIGDELVIAAGERIPVDGSVVEGRSSIDRSMLTGEPIPIDVGAESRVEAGTLNGNGTLVVRALAVGEGTELARIIALVRAAQGSLPPVQRLADRVAGIFVPAILAIALLTCIGWLVTHHAWNVAVVAAVAVLVVACPCALGLATPTAIIAGVGVAARRGVLFKDAVSLEALASVDTILLDKTGTLTVGTPAVTASTSDETLAIAAALERGSSHPLARAIVAAADAAGATPLVAEHVVTENGAGVSGTIGGTHVVVGSARFIRERGVDFAPLDAPASTVYVTRAGTLVGSISFGDALRSDAARSVSELLAQGLLLAVVSGDASAPVAAIAKRAGIATWYAEQTPEGKAAIVANERQRGRRVAFVGDGINDAPALARADIGVAVGGGSAVALETAGVALLSSAPTGLVAAIDIARDTMRTIRQNLFWAFAYNVVLVPLAVFGVVTPVYAAAAMGLSSLFVVGNSLRLAARRNTA